MARRFTPPPNWPAAPQGWTPPEGWQPDPSWGPAPQGWEFWRDDDATAPVDDETPFATASSAPQSPTTAQSPSTTQWAQSPWNGGQATGTSSFGTNPGTPGAFPAAGAHPTGASARKWYANPLLWLALLGVLLLGVLALAFGLNDRDGDDDAAPAASSSASAPVQSQSPSAEPSESGTTEPAPAPATQNVPYGPAGEGSDTDHPLPFGQTTAITNPRGTFTVTVDAPTMDATAALASAGTPKEGKRFVLVPVSVTYTGAETVSVWENLVPNFAFFAADGTPQFGNESETVAPNDLFLAEDVSDGEVVAGDLLLEVPADAADGYIVMSLTENDNDIVFFGPVGSGGAL